MQAHDGTIDLVHGTLRVQGGAVAAVGVSVPVCLTAMPELPPMKEAGLPDFVSL